MSLYRKYRPQSFADVVGQDHIVMTLEQAVEQGKLSHAYLFAGSRGTGKTSVARILAKILLAQSIGDEALQRQIIRGVEEGTIVDLIEIDAASSRRIEDVRDLIEKIQFSPVVASAKVYIIDEAHMLTKEAFNALLKTLEEPPSYAYFILATTELQKIPATIQSRCQRFLFRHVREEEIIRRLQYIADQEHVAADRGALRAIAHHAQGAVRDAIGLLDQLRSLEKITAEDVRARIGETGHEHVEAVLEAIAKGDTQAIIETVATLEETGVPLDAFLRALLQEIRLHLHDAVAKNEPTERLTDMLDTLLMALRDVRIAPVPGLVVEAALLSLLDSDPKASKKSWVFRKRSSDDSEKPKTKAKVAKEEPAEEAKKEPDAKHAAIVEAPELSLPSVLEAWPEIVAADMPAAVRMSLKNGRVQSVSEKGITVRFTSAFHRDKVAEVTACRHIESFLVAVFKRPVHLECVLEEETVAAAMPSADMVNLADAASEIF